MTTRYNMFQENANTDVFSHLPLTCTAQGCTHARGTGTVTRKLGDFHCDCDSSKTGQIMIQSDLKYVSLFSRVGPVQSSNLSTLEEWNLVSKTTVCFGEVILLSLNQGEKDFKLTA